MFVEIAAQIKPERKFERWLAVVLALVVTSERRETSRTRSELD